MTHRTVEGHRALVVPAVGAVRQVVLEPIDDGALDALRWHIGCDFVDAVAGPGCTIWVDDDGIGRERSYNARASALFNIAGVVLYGTAVVTGPPDERGDVTPLSADGVAWAMKTMGGGR